MRLSRYSGWLSLLVFTWSAQADIYRCDGAFGEPSFSRRPCADGIAITEPDTQVGAGHAPGLRPTERAWLQQRERGHEQAGRVVVPSAAAGRKADAAAYRCLRKRRALDAVKAEMRRGYKPARGERLRRRRRGYEDYLAAFCS